jgi:hypothetical protein
MPHRSQRHVFTVQLPTIPITNVLPNVATIAAAGAVGRIVTSLGVSGGNPPITYTIVNAGGLALTIAGNLLKTTADPVGALGAATVDIGAYDSRGQSLTESITVTVT